MSIRVAIIEDEREVREELIQQVRQMPHCELDYAIGSLQELLKNNIQKDYNPDVVLVDLFLGKGQPGGLSILEFYNEKKKHPKIIVLSSYCDELTINETEMKGANAHIKKSLTAGSHPSFLENIILKVCDERKPMGFLSITSESVQKIENRFVSSAIPSTKLSKQQTAFLKLYLEGKTQIEIAKMCEVSESTVNNVFAVMRSKKKFNVSTNAQLIKKVVETNISL
jgi:DNA-binding NarL/FixJ family response regulator